MAISKAIDARGSQKPFIMRKGISVLADLADGMHAASLALQGAKTVYYVEGNAGSDTSDGLSWETAFKTLTVALAASNADIASNSQGWASRNVILVKGDALTEDLVLLAQKTDVIGVGSYNAKAQACLVGNHVPTGTTTTIYGTRFFNMRFMGDASGGDIWTLDDEVSDLEFHNCIFHAESTTAATAAIVNTASPFLGLYGNEFRGLWSDACIEFGAGDGLRGTRIIGNYIEGANVGIEISSSATNAGETGSLLDCVIKDNVINTAGLCIDDDANLAFIIGNYCFTDGDSGSGGVDVIDGNTDISANNRISGSDIDNTEWPALGTLG